MGLIDLMLLQELLDDDLDQLLVEDELTLIVEAQVVVDPLEHLTQCCTSFVSFLVDDCQYHEFNLIEEFFLHPIDLCLLHQTLILNDIVLCKENQTDFNEFYQKFLIFFLQFFCFEETSCESVFLDGVTTKTIILKVKIVF